MKNYKKNYIARGRQVAGMEIVKFTVSLKALQEIAHEFNGEMYVSFEVSKLQSPDEKGRTHTLYQFEKEQQVEQPVAQEPAPTPTKKGKSRK